MTTKETYTEYTTRRISEQFTDMRKENSEPISDELADKAYLTFLYVADDEWKRRHTDEA